MFNSVFSLDLKQRQPSMESKGCKNQCSNNCPQVLQVMQIKPPSFQAGKEYIAMWLAVRVIPLLEKKPYLVVIRFICHDNFLWSNTRQSQEAQSHILPDLNSCGSKTQMVDTSQKIVQKKNVLPDKFSILHSLQRKVTVHSILVSTLHRCRE